MKFSNLQNSTTNRHFWHGSPGQWRKFLSAANAEGITAAQAAIFQQFDFDIAAADPATAENVLYSRWTELCQ